MVVASAAGSKWNHEFAQGQFDRITRFGAAGDGFRELHVRNAGLESRELDRPARANRRDEVGLHRPCPRHLGRNCDLVQLWTPLLTVTPAGALDAVGQQIVAKNTVTAEQV